MKKYYREGCILVCSICGIKRSSVSGMNSHWESEHKQKTLNEYFK